MIGSLLRAIRPALNVSALHHPDGFHHVMRTQTFRPPDEFIQGLTRINGGFPLEDDVSFINLWTYSVDRDAHLLFPVVKLPEVGHHSPVSG